MPDIINGQKGLINENRGRYAHLLREVADTNKVLRFAKRELPATGVASIRTTARYYGLRIAVTTEPDGTVLVRVFSKGGV